MRLTFGDCVEVDDFKGVVISGVSEDEDQRVILANNHDIMEALASQCTLVGAGFYGYAHHLRVMHSL